MGTKTTLQHKHMKAGGMIQAALNHKIDIDKEKAISEIMISCFCERRKAMEIIKAHAIRAGFIEEKLMGKRIYICPKAVEEAPTEESATSEEADEALNGNK